MAKKNKVVESLFDMSVANGLMNEYKGVTLKNAPDFIKKIASADTSEGIMRRLGTLAFYVGRDVRAKGAVGHTFDAEFDRFAADFWKHDKRPTDSSITGYKSRCNAFCEAGQMPYDATPIVKQALAVKDASFSWRAGAVRKMLKAHKEKAPSAQAIVEAFTVTASSGGNERTGDATVKALLTSGINAAQNDKVIAYLATNAALAAELRPFLDMCLTRHRIAMEAKKEGSETRKALANEVNVIVANLAKLDKVSKAQPRARGRQLDS